MDKDRAALTRQVKEANDIVDVVGGYVSLRPAGPTYKGLCPFHEDHRPSFDVDPRRQRYRCWACGKSGDVFTFIEEHERVDFREALELLARRAGITLEKNANQPQDSSRAVMIEVVRWAGDMYQRCLLDSPVAETARKYLGERSLSGEIVRRFQLGYAPAGGEWLVQRAGDNGISFEMLERVGLIARRNDGNGYYDRFRDRVLFPIRNARGQTVGFGGRILPSSPLAAKAPKYYNSADTPLFTKSEQLYGIDMARQAAAKNGYLAVVEGYTDVLMAHQHGIGQVVATMGTALNSRHVQQLRRFAPRVVLVFDADAGGSSGVDRALEIFVSQEVDLAIATLPQGKDPCDLMVEQGAEPFAAALAAAVDALDFKLNQVLSSGEYDSVEGRRQAVDVVLKIIAQAPENTGRDSAIKRQLIVTRLVQRLGLNEATVWARMRELRREATQPQSRSEGEEVVHRTAPASKREVELLEVLLADAQLVPGAVSAVVADELEHPGLRQLLQGLYDLHAAGETPDLDGLRPRIPNQRLIEYALNMQDVGLQNPNREGSLKALLEEFRKRKDDSRRRNLQHQIQTAPDHANAIEVLRQIQSQSVSIDP